MQGQRSMTCTAVCYVLLLFIGSSLCTGSGVPVVINTWSFTTATAQAWEALVKEPHAQTAALDAIEAGCSTCEREQCDFTVGFGGSPDETSETTLDAIIVEGADMQTHMEVGAVCDLRSIRDAISTARLVMQHTTHTTLVGLQASAFALEMGMKLSNLSTPASSKSYYRWTEDDCQPNFRREVLPDPSKSCGPYHRVESDQAASPYVTAHTKPTWASHHNHDTIAMVAIDAHGNIAAGASSNGAAHKVPGRIGDACVAGGASYADSTVGGCGSTGDGDLHLRFQPCYQVVESMRQGAKPQAAAEDAIRRIVKYYPSYVGALFAIDKEGNHAGACHGWTFQYSIQNSLLAKAHVVTVQPISVVTAYSPNDAVK